MNAAASDNTGHKPEPRKTKRRAPIETREQAAVYALGETVEGPLVDYLLKGRGDDRMAVYHAVQAGFPLADVLRMVNTSEAFRRGGVLAKIIGASDRTLARRLQEPARMLSAEQSTRALCYAETMEKATDVLGSRALAEQWLVQPARGLDGEAPLDLIANAVGFELVNDFLTRMDYGVY